MKRPKAAKALLLCATIVISLLIGPIYAQDTDSNPSKNQMKITAAQWKAAAAAYKKIHDKAALSGPQAPPVLQVDPVSGYYIPDYFTTANWANSPALTKFVDPLPQLYISGVSAVPGAGTQYMPVAVPDKTTYPGSDYYEIELGEYNEKMHSELVNGTTLRGYRQTNTTDPVVSQFHYLGPLIIATTNRPVRVKFTNSLPTGALYVPNDPTIMGASDYQIDYNPETKEPMELTTGFFSEGRATLHLHGGLSPWISDGTPHQWTAPIGDTTTTYPKGVSVSYVPDMWFDASGNTIVECAGQTICPVPGATNNPGRGKLTFYWTNAQSARLLFYHDHAFGITRLNVYIGEAAGYLINDPALEDRLAALGVPGTLGSSAGTTDLGHLIPLVVQDKTFVDANTIMTTDPTWAWGTNPGKPVTAQPVTGDLWWPHVYMPAQNPFMPDFSGINPFGRWHYGPWFFPPTPVCGSSPDAVKPYCIDNGVVPNEYYALDPNCSPTPTELCLQAPDRPSTPNPSWGAEAFLDTMIVNGTAYPTLTVQPTKYRFQVLNASHDRFVNLQLYRASNIISAITVTNAGSGYTEAPTVVIVGDGTGATASATIDPNTGQVTGITMDTVGSGYTSAFVSFSGGGGSGAAASATIYSQPTEVGMVPAVLTSGFPAGWPTDSREGGVPDPTTRGPAFIQLGSEGGVLPSPVALPNHPIMWNMDVTTFNFGNVLQQNQGGGALILAPAERADVIVDFSKFSGKTLILYNDAPTAFPALDPHYDYYTGAPDRTDMGGYVSIPPGVGPNVRTIMQIVVAAGGTSTAPVNDYNSTFLNTMKADFAAPTGVFASTQHPIIVGQSAYNSTYNHTFPALWPNWGVSRISDSAISFETVNANGSITLTSNFMMERKAIHDEMGASFDDYGRMSAKLGLEVPFANAATQNFILQGYMDPSTEIVNPDEIQIWRITHNGVDTHPIHFHLFDVQVVNRVGWDGFIRLPDENERGWKDTVRVSPLEDTIVALRPIKPPVPFALPNSIRPLNPARPLNSQESFSQIDITTGGNAAQPITNQMVNFGWEYVWHCHILSHEENDMMRSVTFAVPPEAPSNLTVSLRQGSGAGTFVRLQWRDNSRSEQSFVIQRATDVGGPWGTIATIPSTTEKAINGFITYDDQIGVAPDAFVYRVQATNVVGDTVNAITAGYPTLTTTSGSSNTSGIGTAPPAPLDFNNDGKPDILWRNTSTGDNVAWYMDGISYLGTGVLPPVADQSWTIVGTADFNADSKLDVLWRNTSTGDNAVWYLDGVSYIGFALLPAVTDQAWTVAGTPDFSDDSKPDILWRNTSTGTISVWYMDGVTYVNYASLPTVSDQAWVIAGTADFNADNKPDILWRNTSTGDVAVWYMNGASYVGYAMLPAVGDQAWQVASIADFNSDGRPDILWRNTAANLNVVWYMNGANYAGFDLLPTASDLNWQIVP